MTFVEFFDSEVMDNICSSLVYSPAKVIILGENSKLIKKYIERYKRIFEDRGKNVEFAVKTIQKNDLSSITEVLCEIIEKGIINDEEFAFDLTGGDDLCLVAMGMVFERYREFGIQMHRFNLRNNKIYDCDADGNVLKSTDYPQMSVVENIRAFGGDVVFSGEGKGTFIWNFNKEFIEDVGLMWSIIRYICKYRQSGKNYGSGAWNAQVNVFEAMEKYGEVENLTTKAEINSLKICMASDGKKYKYISKVTEKISQYGLAKIENNGETITVCYKNEQVKRCLTKAGQALELYVYLIALQAKEKDGTPVYNDVMTGVYIDWDGDIHTAQDGCDIENEVDVIMMHGVVPVFVSCKNGKAETDELYKLNAVATKFGGKYVKKVLVATALGSGKSAEYFRLRARDMNIRLIEPPVLTDEQFFCEIGNSWNKTD